MASRPPYSLTWRDYYDFIRCPKIVSMQTHWWKNPPPVMARTKSRAVADSGALTPQEIGLIGELGTEEAFATDNEVEDADPTELEANLERRALPKIRVSAQAAAKRLIDEVATNLATVRDEIRQTLPGLHVVGKGTVRFGYQTGLSRPDFLAETRGGKRVFIETKTTQDESPQHEFQGAWYNSIARVNSPSVIESQKRDGAWSVTATTGNGPVEKTVLLYTRTGTSQVITRRLPLENLHTKVWQAKQLGLRGLSPATTCANECAHHKLEKRTGTKLKEGNIEPHPPMATIMGQDVVDAGIDLDQYYLWQRFQACFRESIGDIRLHYVRNTGAWKNFSTTLLQDWGIPELQAGRLLALRPGDFVPNGSLAGSLGEEFQWWAEALGENRASSAEGNAARQSKKVFPLPTGSSAFVKASRKPWRL